jgi:N-formylglutamate deformylase
MNNIKSIIWEMIPGNGPVIAAAIHDGHDLRDEVKEIISLTENERLREEDPFTGVMTKAGDMQIIGLRSRFEIDLNRPREKAVYLNPEDAWGLKVWKKELPDLIKQTSLEEYDAFL